MSERSMSTHKACESQEVLGSQVRGATSKLATKANFRADTATTVVSRGLSWVILDHRDHKLLEEGKGGGDKKGRQRRKREAKSWSYLWI